MGEFLKSAVLTWFAIFAILDAVNLAVNWNKLHALQAGACASPPTNDYTCEPYFEMSLIVSLHNSISLRARNSLTQPQKPINTQRQPLIGSIISGGCALLLWKFPSPLTSLFTVVGCILKVLLTGVALIFVLYTLVVNAGAFSINEDFNLIGAIIVCVIDIVAYSYLSYICLICFRKLKEFGESSTRIETNNIDVNNHIHKKADEEEASEPLSGRAQV